MKSDQNLLEHLRRAAGSGEVVTEEPMSRHTTFRIGGPADYFVTPHTKEEIRQVIRLCKEEEIPFAVLGNGSNLLVGDKGFRGVIIQLFKNFSNIIIEEENIYAQSGALLVRLANQAAKQGLTGLEFASGIPGTLGGAVVMNAGAYGGEMKDVVVAASVMDRRGEIRVLSPEELQLSYRHSVLQEDGRIVLDITLEVVPANGAEVLAKMEELSQRRISKQPLEMPSAGSVFKRPEGCFVGPLIEKAGLKGFRIGGAQISVKHAGFIVNAGNATAADVLALISYIRNKIWTDYQVQLKPEVLIIGEE